MSKAKQEKVGVIGSGLIGRSWAMLFAGAGYQVSIYDINHDQLANALQDIDKQLHELKEKDLLRSNIPPADQLRSISVTRDLAECMKDAVHVQECVWESLEAKTAIFKQIDGLAKPGQVLASSTSTIPGSKFTSDLVHRKCCIVAHPVNPPFYCPLTEVVPTPHTDKDVVDRCMAIMKEIGQVPVRFKKEILGFAVNRLQYALLAECWNLIADDVLDVDGIDKVMSDGLGCRYAFLGPLEVTHLNANGVVEYSHKYNNGYLNVCRDLKPAPSWETPALLERVRSQLEAAVPLEKLEERRRYRDVRLAALAKLKRDLDKAERASK